MISDPSSNPIVLPKSQLKKKRKREAYEEKKRHRKHSKQRHKYHMRHIKTLLEQHQICHLEEETLEELAIKLDVKISELEDYKVHVQKLRQKRHLRETLRNLKATAVVTTTTLAIDLQFEALMTDKVTIECERK
jgi:hypothetical protein